MKSKSKKKIWIIILSLAILALVIALVAITNKKGKNNNTAAIEKADASSNNYELSTKEKEVNSNLTESEKDNTDVNNEENVEKTQSEDKQDVNNQEVQSENNQNSGLNEESTANTSAQENEVNTTENMENDQVYSLQAGTVLDESAIGDGTDYFKIYEISEGDSVYNRINGKSYRKNSDIAFSDLRYLKILYYDFSNQIKVGEIIVNKSIADSTLSVFRDLFAEKYQIHSVELVDNYWTGDGASTDIASQAADNTSAFNYRMTTSGKKLSNHALGKAIDINPLENPYIITEDGVQHCDIDASAPYFDRDSGLPHIILKGDSCESIFEKYGFKWGGDWTNPVDYQHFEKK